MKIMFVSGEIPYQVVAWATVVGTIAAIIIAIVLIAKSWKYVRALCKRHSLKRRLKTLCRRNGYTFEKRASFYKSVFTVTNEPEIEIGTPEGKYSIKLFACLNHNDTYTLDTITHFTSQSNGKVMYAGHPGTPKSPNVSAAHFLGWQHNPKNEIVNEVTLEGGNKDADAAEGTKKILCINPIPVEVRRVAMSTTEQVFDGDEIDGHTVYSGDALCRALG